LKRKHLTEAAESYPGEAGKHAAKPLEGRGVPARLNTAWKSSAAGQGFRCRRRRCRAAKVEALRTVATEVVHDSLLSDALDSLGDQMETKRLPEAYDPFE